MQTLNNTIMIYPFLQNTNCGNPQIASLNHVIFCFVSQRETPVVTMVFTWLPLSSLSQTLFLLTHSAQWHWPSVSSWNAICSTFGSFLFENFCTPLPSEICFPVCFAFLCHGQIIVFFKFYFLWPSHSK